MKASDLRELSSEELVSKGTELRDELFNARVRHGTGQVENTARLERLRRDIARVETVLGEKGRANDE